MHLTKFTGAQPGGQKFCHPNHPRVCEKESTLERDRAFAPTIHLSDRRLNGVKMSSRDVLFRYKETRLNLEPTSPSSVIELRVPASSSHGRSNSQRTNGTRHSAEADEQAWRSKNLATASSIYRRKHHGSPQSFLWRVLENNTVLSIRAADVSKPNKEPDAPLVLHLRFPSAIRDSCIGFSDSEDHEALSVFVVDHANNLYAITLRLELFKKRSATEGGLGEACKSYSPPGFGFKHPHRLVAVSPDQLIITMHDGGILRFDRNRSHDGGLTRSLFQNAVLY